MHSREQLSRWLLASIIVASVVAHFGLIALSQTVLRNWLWVSEPAHAAVETAGALTALWVARLLVGLDEQGRGTSYNLRIAAAFVGMGAIDALHAVVPAGNLFVWLHSIATLIGGAILLLLWLPPLELPTRADTLLRRYGALAVLLAAAFLAIGSLLLPERIPLMVVDGRFSPAAQQLNVMGGIFMLAAAVRLLLTYNKHKNFDDLLFFLHCVLFGSAAVMFEQSQLWDSAWWGWHALRLMAYGVALWFIIHIENRTRAETTLLLQQTNVALEAGVAARTHELRIMNEDLAMEIVARIRATSEREALQQQLIKASRRAGMAELANGVLHDVGNVLNSINVAAQQMGERLGNSVSQGLHKTAALLSGHPQGLADLLNNDRRGKQIPEYLNKLADQLDKQHEDGISELEKIRKGVQHVVAIIRAHRVDATGGELVAEQVSMADLVEKCVDIAREAARADSDDTEQRSIDWRLDVDDGLEVLIDSNKAQQILINLLRNAIRAVLRHDTPKPTIVVRATQEAALLTIRVRDNGCGIPAENLAKLFDYGFTTYGDGAGFGLHMSHRNAALLGGELRAKSAGKNQGATFTLELPLRRAPAKITAIAN